MIRSRVGRACVVLVAGVAASLLLAAPARSAPPVVKVILLGGQSNMQGYVPDQYLPTAWRATQDDVLFCYYQNSTFTTSPLTTLRPGSGNLGGFGPELSFGRTIADALPNETFALIKHGEGSTSLQNDWDPVTGAAYARFRLTVTAGLTALTDAGYDYEIAGMLWTQGEKDAKTAGMTTEQYTSDLKDFISDVRDRYGANLPFLLSQLSVNQTNITSTQLGVIRAAQESVAADDAYAWMIDTDAMSVSSDPNWGYSIHFDAAGQLALGQAFGQTYLNAVPEPAGAALLGLGGLAVVARRRRR